MLKKDLMPHCFGSYEKKNFNCCACTFNERCLLETADNEIDEIEDERR